MLGLPQAPAGDSRLDNESRPGLSPCTPTPPSGLARRTHRSTILEPTPRSLSPLERNIGFWTQA